MNIISRHPRKMLNKAYLKLKPNRLDIERFKSNLIRLMDNIHESESEEYHKNLMIEFLKDTFYTPNHFINVKDTKDLVIHLESQSNSPVGVIVEVKKPSNLTEMITQHDLNKKAFQQLVLYYLRERFIFKNLEIKNLIVCNIYEWYVFEASTFEKYFAKNEKLVHLFHEFEDKKLSIESTKDFYKEIAKVYIDAIEDIEFAHFDLRNYNEIIRNNNPADDNELIALYKILSPEHLLKVAFANDSNSLNKEFYHELLYILGLEEISDNGQKIIVRPSKEKRNSASFIEQTMLQLLTIDKLNKENNESKEHFENRIFEISLELCITWLNRILFLKLLESQILKYQSNRPEYNFLNDKKVTDFNDLNFLFFDVLALPLDERKEYSTLKFGYVPYLNSSLFEPTTLERELIFISNLKDNLLMPLFTQTVLKDKQGKKLANEQKIIQYLFNFLNAYDFSSEGSGEIQEENKSLINAAVLGLIFEKLNGYQDGSFFTPGFITMFMCRETLRKAVIQKFNESIPPLLRGAGGVSIQNKSTTLESGAVSENNKSTTLETGGVSENNKSTTIESGTVSENNKSTTLESGGVSENNKSTTLEVFNKSIENKNTIGKNRRKIIPYNPALKELARNLRNKSTKTEIILWKQLKGKFNNKYDFHRQKPLDNYIADFFCYELDLVIEIDGKIHNLEETMIKDIEKETKLNELGLNVLRFLNDDILNNLESVLDIIINYIECFEKSDFTLFKNKEILLNTKTGNPPIINTALNPLHSEENTINTVSNSENDEENIINTALNSENVEESIINTPLNPPHSEENIINTALNPPHSEENIINTPLNALLRGDFKSLDEIYEEIGEGRMFTRKRANEIINSIKICDPAVGSGHFLVSALNEIIAIKNDLKIIEDKDGKSLNRYEISVVHDELVVMNDDDELFEYKPKNKESQRVQETLFHEKRNIIENCLFGVDINPNSVKICRLRLWIELLKCAYYKNERELETLPNIDINIKTGNSLLNKYETSDILNKFENKQQNIIKDIMPKMKLLVNQYKHEKRKELRKYQKTGISAYETELQELNNYKDPDYILWQECLAKLKVEKNKHEVFYFQEVVDRLKKEEQELKEKFEAKFAIYHDSFEWRFHFPEVTNEEGKFLGFDVIIGNPPYIQLSRDAGTLGKLLAIKDYKTFERTGDIYALFYEKALSLLKPNGLCCFITSNKWIRAGYGKKLRQWIAKHTNPELLLDFAGIKVFDSATVDVNILLYSSSNNQKQTQVLQMKKEMISNISEAVQNYSQSFALNEDDWIFHKPAKQKIKDKVEKQGIPLSRWNISIKYGIKTGLNDAFIIDGETQARLITEDPKSAEILKPLLRGRDIKKYGYDYDNLWLILFPKGFTIRNFLIEKYNLDNNVVTEPPPSYGNVPYDEAWAYIQNNYSAIAKYLEPFRRKAENRADKGDYWWELRACDYYSDFTKEKIMYPNMTKFIPFVIDKNGFYTNQKCFILTGNHLSYLTAFFNSSLFKYCFLDNFPELQGGTRELSKIFFDKIPVKLVTDEQNEEYRSLVNQIQILKLEHQDTKALEIEIDNKIFDLYELTDEERKIIGFIEIV